MERNASIILVILACLGGSSMLYFLCLVLALPFLFFLVLLVISAIAFMRYMRDVPTGDDNNRMNWAALLVLVIGTFLITNRTYYLVMPGGGWDAWAIWNYHARFLLDKTQWTNLFLSHRFDHPDYPLCLSATIAWITRLLGGKGFDIVSFGISFWLTLATPLLIFTTLQRRNIWIATIVLLFFATDDFYLSNGVSQYADTLLAVFFLAALIAIRHSQSDSRLITLAAFFAGCMAWTKNEGILLATLFFLFYADTFLNRSNLRPLLFGLLPPLVVLTIFKVFYAPGNDLVNGTSDVFAMILTKDRYTLVWQFFLQNGKEYFLPVGYLLLVYFMACILWRRIPVRSLLLVITCLSAYMFVYVLTPYDQQWHLQTSQNRLLHQLMPAMVYALADGLSQMRLSELRPMK